MPTTTIVNDNSEEKAERMQREVSSSEMVEPLMPSPDLVDQDLGDSLNSSKRPSFSLSFRSFTSASGSTSSSSRSRKRTISHTPSIDDAIEFGEKRKPHRIPDETQPSGFRLARVGEMKDPITGAPAESYHVLKTPLQSLDEWGIGISLYFRQLMVLSIIFLICGIISIPAIYHNTRFNPPETSLLATGSVAGATRNDLSFQYTTMVDFVVIVILVLFALLSRKVGRMVSAKIDESQQTAQDYSVVIKNPPPDLRDIEKYHERFRQYGDIVTITLALDNGKLLECIARKKEVERKLAESVEGTRLLEAERLDYQVHVESSPLWKKIGFALRLYEDTPLLWKQRKYLAAAVTNAAKRVPRVKRVFIVFNTEAAQRACLQNMYSGWLERHNFLKPSKPEAVFEGRILLCGEPVEPSEVIWEHLRFRFYRRALRFIISASLSSVLLIASYFSLNHLSGEGKSSVFSALLISLINMLLPLVVKVLTLCVELPLTVSEQQQSILIKLVVARCMNTAVILYLVTSYNETFSADTMASIMTILIADALLAPTLQVLNLPQRIMQRFVAPRQKTQREMNSYFQGLEWHLSERYTEVTKTVFVSIFYSAILPQGLFVTSLALLVNYWSDKYALFNIWKRPPAINARLVTLSRNFFSLTLYLHVAMSRIFFANWPYSDKSERAHCNVLFCKQSDLMTHGQKASIHFYSMVCIVIFFVIFQSYFWYPISVIFNCINRRFTVDGQGKAIDIEYRKVFGVAAYVPLIHAIDIGSNNENWVACDVGNLPRSLIPIQYSLDVNEHNLCSREELKGLSEAEFQLRFSSIRYYAPPTPRRAAVEKEQMAAVGQKQVEEDELDASGVCVPAAISNLVNTAAKPVEKLLLPQDLSALIKKDVYYENDIESESKMESVVPDGWDMQLDENGVFFT